MTVRYRDIFLLVLSAVLLVGAFFVFWLSVANKSSESDFYTQGRALPSSNVTKKQKTPRDSHIKTPVAVKAVYLSQCGAKSEKIRNHVKDLILSTELNSVIIDIKDYTGTVSFPTNLEEANSGEGCVADNMKDIVEEFHKEGIYIIGRITVFQDPLYAKRKPESAVQSKSKKAPWRDYKGLHFIDVGYKDFWKYIVALSKEAHLKYMFDELNYDYIRYPSDGPMRDTAYLWSDPTNKAEELEGFFRYLSYNVKVPDASGHTPVISVDIFGMTTTNYDDLTIGQILEKTLPYFDYVAPMVYPSHYPKWFLGLNNPNEHVYTVVNYSMKKAVQRTESSTTKIPSLKYKKITDESGRFTGLYQKPKYDKSKLRPWLQDFDYGGIYDAKKVRAQIQAVYDAGLNSWMLWDPANIYTREALLPASR